MARFPIVQEDEVVDPAVRHVYNEISRELGFGMVPNIFKSMALRPDLLQATWQKFRATILHGHLPRTLKEMIGVLISQANGSAYAMRVHLHGLSTMGYTDAVLKLLVNDFEQCPLTERDKTVLQFGLLAAQDPLTLTDADFAALREHNLTDAEIFEVLATADLFMAINTYTDSAAVEIDSL